MNEYYNELNQLKEQVRVLQSSIQHMTKKEELSTDVTTTGAVHKAQVSCYGGTSLKNDVSVVGQYGYASAPLSGANCVSVNPYGRTVNKIIVGTHDPRYHPVGLVPGETKVYDSVGQSVYLCHVGTIEIDANTELEVKIGGKTILSVTNGQVQIEGDLKVSGSVTAGGDVVGGGISLDSHLHDVSTAPGTTSPPK